MGCWYTLRREETFREKGLALSPPPLPNSFAPHIPSPFFSSPSSLTKERRSTLVRKIQTSQTAKESAARYIMEEEVIGRRKGWAGGKKFSLVPIDGFGRSSLPRLLPSEILRPGVFGAHTKRGGRNSYTETSEQKKVPGSPFACFTSVEPQRIGEVGLHPARKKTTPHSFFCCYRKPEATV